MIRVSVPELLLVFYERRKALSWIDVSPFLKNFLDGIDEKLECGQPLLAVNNDTTFDRSSGELHLLKDNGAHEVRFCSAVLQD